MRSRTISLVFAIVLAVTCCALFLKGFSLKRNNSQQNDSALTLGQAPDEADQGVSSAETETRDPSSLPTVQAEGSQIKLLSREQLWQELEAYLQSRGRELSSTSADEFMQMCTEGFPAACAQAEFLYADEFWGMDAKITGAKDLTQKLALQRKRVEIQEKLTRAAVKSCSAGIFLSCTQALSQLRGLDEARELERVIQKHCDTGNGGSCAVLAQERLIDLQEWVHYGSEESQEWKDLRDKTRELASKGCEYGVKWSCQDLATGLLHDESDPRTLRALSEIEGFCKDESRATDDLELSHCGFLATRLANRGDPVNALNYANQSCQNGYFMGCVEVSVLGYQSNRDRSTLIAYLRSSCQLLRPETFRHHDSLCNALDNSTGSDDAGWEDLLNARIFDGMGNTRSLRDLLARGT